MTREEMKKVFNDYINIEVGDLMELNFGRMKGKVGIIKEIILHEEKNGDQWEEYTLQVGDDELIFNSSEAFFFKPELKFANKNLTT